MILREGKYFSAEIDGRVSVVKMKEYLRELKEDMYDGTSESEEEKKSDNARLNDGSNNSANSSFSNDSQSS